MTDDDDDDNITTESSLPPPPPPPEGLDQQQQQEEEQQEGEEEDEDSEVIEGKRSTKTTTSSSRSKSSSSRSRSKARGSNRTATTATTPTTTTPKSSSSSSRRSKSRARKEKESSGGDHSSRSLKSPRRIAESNNNNNNSTSTSTSTTTPNKVIVRKKLLTPKQLEHGTPPFVDVGGQQGNNNNSNNKKHSNNNNNNKSSRRHLRDQGEMEQDNKEKVLQGDSSSNNNNNTKNEKKNKKKKKKDSDDDDDDSSSDSSMERRRVEARTLLKRMNHRRNHHHGAGAGAGSAVSRNSSGSLSELEYYHDDDHDDNEMLMVSNIPKTAPSSPRKGLGLTNRIMNDDFSAGKRGHHHHQNDNENDVENEFERIRRRLMESKQQQQQAEMERKLAERELEESKQAAIKESQLRYERQQAEQRMMEEKARKAAKKAEEKERKRAEKKAQEEEEKRRKKEEERRRKKEIKEQERLQKERELELQREREAAEKAEAARLHELQVQRQREERELAEQRRREQEEQERLERELEEERRRMAEEEKLLKLEAEKRELEETRKRLEQKRLAEEEARRQAEEEARRIEEERKRREEEDRLRQIKEAEEREAERIRVENERKQRELEEARLKAEAEAARIREEEEAKRAEEERLAQLAAEAEAQRQKVLEEQRQRELEEQRLREQEEARRAEQERLEREMLEREAQEKKERQEREEREKKEREEQIARERREAEIAERRRQEEELLREEREREEAARREREEKLMLLKKLQKARTKISESSNYNFVTNMKAPKKTRAELAKEQAERPPQPTPRPAHDVYQKRIDKENPNHYTVPHFHKSHDEEETIERALSHILPLQLMPKSNVSKLIGAFERKEYDVGSEIELIKGGDESKDKKDDDEYFYVVENGSVTIEINGETVARAQPGDTVGDTHLYHSEKNADRQRSIMKIQSHNGRGASLMRIDQKTYRNILQTDTNIQDQDKIDLVERLGILEYMKPQHKQKLAAALKPVQFKKGQRVSTIHEISGKDVFCVVSTGRLMCRGGERADLKKASDANPNTSRPVERGGFFGDHVLQPAGDLMWLDTPLKVQAEQDGMAYVIDRKTFETVVGSPKDVLLTPESVRSIQKMDTLKQHSKQVFTVAQMQTIQSTIEETFYSANETILEANMPIEAALYYVRQGTVKIAKGRFHRLLIPGGFFGEDMFAEAKTQDEITGTVEYAHVAKTNCVVGKLSLQDFLALDLRDLTLGGENADEPAPKSAVKKKLMLTKREKSERLANKQIANKKQSPRLTALPETKKRTGQKKPQDNQSSSSSDSSSGSSSSSSSGKGKQASKKEKSGKDDDSPPMSEIKPEAVTVPAEEELDEEVEYIMPKRDFKFENLERRVMLGEGQFGQVWLVTDKTESEKRGYALKIQSKYDLVEQAQAEVCIREKNIMAAMRHPNIIKLCGSFQDTDFVYLLLEMVNGGELFNRIHPIDEDFDNTPQDVGLPEDHARFYAFVVADILKYMHEKKYVYRDLKSENILIQSDGYPVLIDFGFTKKLTEKTFTLCGTPGYLAPEMVTSQGHSFGVDHWAMGVMTFEMLCKHNFFFPEGMDPVTLYKCIAEEPFEPPKHLVSPEGCDFMDQLLQKDPVLRLGALAGGEDDILGHAWFKGMDPKGIRTHRIPAPWVPDIKDPLDTKHFEDWSDVEDKTQERYPALSDDQALIFEDF